MPKLYIGTSGFSFDSWKGEFYPDDVREKDMLAAYSQTFKSVEINNSFYRLPAATTVDKWVNIAPPDFIFAYKANRYITHRKKLKITDEPIERLNNAVAPFGKKLGPILFQLPPRWKVNVERLREFVAALPKKHRYTFEFRDPSWLCDQVYDVLSNRNIALCFYDYRGFQSPEIPTADFVYLRLHGPNPEAYTGSYGSKALSQYAKKIKAWQKQGLDVYCYFDNDQKSCAPADGQVLQKKVGTPD